MMAMASRRRTAMVTFVDANRDRIAADNALVQHLDPGAFDEAELDQPAFEFRRRTAPSLIRPPPDAESRPNSRVWPVPAANAVSLRLLRSCL